MPSQRLKRVESAIATGQVEPNIPAFLKFIAVGMRWGASFAPGRIAAYRAFQLPRGSAMISAYRFLGAFGKTSVAIALSLLVGLAAAAELKLSGDNEVPPVKTSASGSGVITVASDGAVSGSVKTTGVDGTMAHIHMGAAGSNGPVIIPLTKTADGTWTVPAGAKLSDEQMKSYKAGDLYVNVHSAANKGGEIRAQLMP